MEQTDRPGWDTASPPPDRDRRTGDIRPDAPQPYVRSPGLNDERPLTGTEARQGFLNRPLFYGLILGLVLAGLFVIGTQIWTVSEPLPNQEAINTPVDAQPAPAPNPDLVRPAPAATPVPQ